VRVRWRLAGGLLGEPNTGEMSERSGERVKCPDFVETLGDADVREDEDVHE